MELLCYRESQESFPIAFEYTVSEDLKIGLQLSNRAAIFAERLAEALV
jgi:hypothetical protein